MNFITKLFNQEIIKGYKLEKEENAFQGGTNSKWTIKRGVRTHDNLQVSLFIIKKSELDKNENIRQEISNIIIKEAKNLIKVRHPSFLKILEPVFEDLKQIVFVTERIEYSIESALKQNYKFEEDIELKMNIKNILVGIDFLNNKLNAVHLDMAPENIFILPNGNWKIGGLTFLKTIFQDNFDHDSNFNKIDKCSRIKPNFVYASPELFTNINTSCDIFSFALVLYRVFSGIKNKSSILPESIASQSESQSFQKQILGIKKMFILEVFPEDMKTITSNILKYNNNVLISDFLNSGWFVDPKIKILNYMTEFMTKTEQQQKDFICSFYLFIDQFNTKIIINQIIPFLKNFIDNTALRAYILSLFVLILEKNILDAKINRDIIWPLIKSYFNSKHLNSHMLYVLIFYINHLIILATIDEIENLILPFFLKCLVCKHSKTQQLVIQRIELIFNKIQKDELKKKIFLKILALVNKSDFEITLFSIKFLINNVQSMEKDVLSNNMFNHLENFLKEQKNYKTIIYDLVFELITKMCKIEEKDSLDAIFKYLKLFLIILTETNISKEVFADCYEMVLKLFTSIKKRENELKNKEIDTTFENFKYVSIYSSFKQNQIVSEDILDIINNKNSNQFSLKNNDIHDNINYSSSYNTSDDKINIQFKNKVNIPTPNNHINFQEKNQLSFNHNKEVEGKLGQSNFDSLPNVNLNKNEINYVTMNNKDLNHNNQSEIKPKSSLGNFTLDLTKKNSNNNKIDLFQNMNINTKNQNENSTNVKNFEIGTNGLKINNDLYNDFDFNFGSNSNENKTNANKNKKQIYFSKKEDKEETFI